MEDFPVVTLLVIGMTTAVSYFGFQDQDLIRKYVFDVKKIIQERQFYRLISSALFHVNWTHLLFNMFSFYAFAAYMEQVVGSGRLILLYLLSIIGGGILSVVINKNREYLALGASGGVSGVIFTSIFVVPGGSIVVFPVPVPIPPWLYAGLFVLVSMYGMRKQIGNVGHDAHLGGALTGLLFALWAYPAFVARELTFFLIIILAIITFIGYIIKNPA